MLVLRRTSSEGGALGAIKLTWRLTGRSPAPPPMYEHTQIGTKQSQKRGLHPQPPKSEEQKKAEEGFVISKAH